MGLYGILLYSGRALGFAALCTLVYALFLRLRRKRRFGRPEGRKLLLVFYLAALLQITVIRRWSDFLALGQHEHSWATVHLLPFETTRLAMRQSVWALVYNVLGNLLWFMPLGLLAPSIWPRLRRLHRAALLGAGVSLLIELSQWVFASGESDIDDVIFNALGAAAGFLCGELLRKIRRRRGISP